MNTDTKDKTVVGEVSDDAAERIPGASETLPTQSRATAHPLFLVGMGLAFVAIGYEFMEEGKREARARGVRLPPLPFTAPYAALDR